MEFGGRSKTNLMSNSTIEELQSSTDDTSVTGRARAANRPGPLPRIVKEGGRRYYLWPKTDDKLFEEMEDTGIWHMAEADEEWVKGSAVEVSCHFISNLAYSGVASRNEMAHELLDGDAAFSPAYAREAADKFLKAQGYVRAREPEIDGGEGVERSGATARC